MTTPIDDFVQDELAGLVFYRSVRAGPGIVLMHELPGLTPACIALGRRLNGCGFTVYMPLLFGAPGDHATTGHFLRLCVNREFHLFAAGRSSPVTRRLRQLGRRVAEECPGPGVGVIGMCLTGGFVLAMLVDAHAVAGVVCQPSIPLPPCGSRRADLCVSEPELAAVRANAAAHVLGLRFQRDLLSPPQRMDRLQALLGDRFERVEMPSSSWRDHATLTDHFRPAEHRPYFERVVNFFAQRLQAQQVATG